MRYHGILYFDIVRDKDDHPATVPGMELITHIENVLSHTPVAPTLKFDNIEVAVAPQNHRAPPQVTK